MDIKKVIKEHGLTLENVATQMTKKDGTKGISSAALSQIISGNPTLSRLQEIADILGISLSELFMEQKDGATLICPHCGKKLNIRIE